MIRLTILSSFWGILLVIKTIHGRLKEDKYKKENKLVV